MGTDVEQRGEHLLAASTMHQCVLELDDDVAPPEQLVQLLELQLARAVGVPAVEERVDLVRVRVMVRVRVRVRVEVRVGVGVEVRFRARVIGF